MVCQFLLYNKVNQLYIYIYPHISSLLRLPLPLPIPPIQVVTKHQADLPVLPTSYLFYIWQCIYVHATLSLRPSLPFPLPVSSTPFSMSASLFLFCTQVRQNHLKKIIRFHIYVIAYRICFSLSDFTLYDRLQVHPPHYK